MKFEIICKQEKKSFIGKDKKEKEYIETRFFLHSDELKQDLEFFPYYREIRDSKGDVNRIITNKDTIKALSTIVKNY